MLMQISLLLHKSLRRAYPNFITKFNKQIAGMNAHAGWTPFPLKCSIVARARGKLSGYENF